MPVPKQPPKNMDMKKHGRFPRGAANKEPVVQTAEEHQKAMTAPSKKSDVDFDKMLQDKLRVLMQPSNGYEGVTPEDIQAMLEDNVDRAKAYTGWHLNNPGGYEQEIARIQATQDAISRGDPAVFSGEFDGPLGYYAQDNTPGNKTGQAVFGPGGEKWNPNRAQANLLILRTLLEEGYKAGLAAKGSNTKSNNKAVVQSAADNQRGK